MQTAGEPGEHWHEVTGKGFVNRVEAMSGGRIKFKLSGSGSIVPNAEILTATGQGILDVAMTGNFYHSGKLPVAALEYGVPGQYRNLYDQFLLMSFHEPEIPGFLEILRDAYAEHNVYFVNGGADGELALLLNKKVESLADLQKVKLRVGGAFGKVLGKAGASVTYMPGGELYTAMATGVIDGVCYGGIRTASNLGLNEVSKYLLQPDLFGGHMITDWLVNMEVWNSLPDDLKAVFDAAGEAMFGLSFVYSAGEAAEARAAFIAGGGEIITWPAEDYEKINEYSIEVLEEMAAKDPKYTGPTVELIKKMMASG